MVAGAIGAGQVFMSSAECWALWPGLGGLSGSARLRWPEPSLFWRCGLFGAAGSLSKASVVLSLLREVREGAVHSGGESMHESMQHAD